MLQGDIKALIKEQLLMVMVMVSLCLYKIKIQSSNLISEFHLLILKYDNFYIEHRIFSEQTKAQLILNQNTDIF